jgi:hypothetical protein
MEIQLLVIFSIFGQFWGILSKLDLHEKGQLLEV